MRVFAFESTMPSRIPTLRRLRAAPPRRVYRPADAPVEPAPDPEPASEPAPRTPLAPEARVREAGGPEDRAHYSCSCGLEFRAPVSASVACPHCGSFQDW